MFDRDLIRIYLLIKIKIKVYMILSPEMQWNNNKSIHEHCIQISHYTWEIRRKPKIYTQNHRHPICTHNNISATQNVHARYNNATCMHVWKKVKEKGFMCSRSCVQIVLCVKDNKKKYAWTPYVKISPKIQLKNNKTIQISNPAYLCMRDKTKLKIYT